MERCKSSFYSFGHGPGLCTIQEYRKHIRSINFQFSVKLYTFVLPEVVEFYNSVKFNSVRNIAAKRSAAYWANLLDYWCRCVNQCAADLRTGRCWLLKLLNMAADVICGPLMHFYLIILCILVHV